MGGMTAAKEPFVLVQIPCTSKFTFTYERQATGYDVQEGPAGYFVRNLSKEIQRIELEQGGLIPELEAIDSSMESRGRIFLDYLGNQADFPDLEQLASTVCTAIPEGDDLVRASIIEYIRTGEKHSYAFRILSTHIPVLGELLEYGRLKAEISQPSPAEKADFEKKVGEMAMALLPLLKEAGADISGIVEPVRYKNSSEVPEELRTRYVPMQQLTQYITCIENALCSVALRYLRHTNWKVLAGEKMAAKFKDVEVKPGFVLKSLLTENWAVQKLYPLERVISKTARELQAALSPAISQHFRSGRLAEAIAEGFGLSTDEAKEGVETLVSILDSVMPIIPETVYDTILARDKLESIAKAVSQRQDQIDANKRNRGRLSEAQRRAHNLLVAQKRGIERSAEQLYPDIHRMFAQLKAEFEMDAGTMNTYDDSTAEEAIRLFGEERIGFIRNIFTSSPAFP